MSAENKATTRGARLLYASQQGHPDIVDAILDAKNVSTDPNVRGDDGTTPLIYATYNGHTDIVDTLLEKGADPNLKTKTDGNTALVYASHSDQLMVANALLKHKANPNIENRFGNTALDYATEGRMHDLLVENGGTAGSSPNRASRVSQMENRGAVRNFSRHRSYRRKNAPKRTKRTRRNRRA
jgi:hypothetical protein